MTSFEKVMLVLFVLLCIVGFVPAVKNFLSVLRDKHNSRVTPSGRLFLLSYLAIGVAAIIFTFFFSIYSLVTRW